MAVALAIGVVKIGRDMYRWRVDQVRDKAPWERAGEPDLPDS